MHELDVEGMTCSHCQKAVEDALRSVPGADRVDVDLATGRAVVNGSATVEALVRAVENEGYRATRAG